MPEIITAETLRDPAYCPVSKDHKHKHDIHSLCINYDGGEAYIDINCKLCGRSGCAGKFDPDSIDW